MHSSLAQDIIEDATILNLKHPVGFLADAVVSGRRRRFHTSRISQAEHNAEPGLPVRRDYQPAMPPDRTCDLRTS